MKRVIAAIVAVVCGTIAGSGVSGASPRPSWDVDGHPTTLVIHDIPKAYWDAIDRCTNDGSVNERIRCIRQHPYDADHDPRCLRVQLLYPDGHDVTTRNDCGY